MHLSTSTWRVWALGAVAVAAGCGSTKRPMVRPDGSATGGISGRDGDAAVVTGGAGGGQSQDPCVSADSISFQSVAAGALHTCALTTGGGVRCWGRHTSGEIGDGSSTTTLHPSMGSTDILTGVKTLSAGAAATCALMTTGDVRCWGSNFDGVLGDGTKDDRNTPTASVLSGVKAIGVSVAHTCALMTTGGVRCWGQNSMLAAGVLGDGTTMERLTPPATDVATDVQSIAVGGYHTCILTTAGGVRCWGQNRYGQLGDGTTTARNTPPLTDVMTGIQAIAAGVDHTCALTTAGGVRCWGSNEQGQLGDGGGLNARPTPGPEVLTGVQAIAAAKAHTCALMISGGVRCWGSNANGQFGDGTTSSRATPPATDVITGVRAIGAGTWSEHTCAALSSGGIRCWGWNVAGQLGDGRAGGLRDLIGGIKAIDMGSNTCALTEEGGVRCWDDALGEPPTTDLVNGVQAISVGTLYICVLSTANGVRCWGENGYGQLGDGTTTTRMTPPTAEIMGDVRGISAGSRHACAVTSAGGVHCWGQNQYGQLGDGTTTDRSRPTADVLGGVQAVAAEGSHTCALMVTGGVRCWGANTEGQLGLGKPSEPVLSPPLTDVLTGVQAISVGLGYTCALMAAGGVRCWGFNVSGETGDGSTMSSVPAPPPTDILTGAKVVASGWHHSCAVTTSGDVRCWGANEYHQADRSSDVVVRTPSPMVMMKDAQAVTASPLSTCGLSVHGGVRCWGVGPPGHRYHRLPEPVVMCP